MPSLHHQPEQDSPLQELSTWRNVVDGLPYGLWAVDTAGNTILVNKAMAKLLGRRQEDLRCASIADFVDTADRGFAARIIGPRETDQEYEIQLRLCRADGSIMPMACTVTTLLDDEGQISGSLAVFQEPAATESADDVRANLAAIVESSDDAIVAKDLNGIITSWNKGAQRIFGYSPDEVIGQPVTMLMPPERKQEETAILARLQKGERVDHFQTVRVTKDGKLIDVSVTISPIRNSKGKIVGASKVARDITDRQSAEADRVHLAAIVESSDDAIISKTLDGTIHSWNRSAERLFGYTAHEAIGKPITMLVPPEKMEEEAQIVQRLRRGQRIDHLETVRVAKDGRKLDVWETVSPVYDHTGIVTGASKVVRDISDIKELERQRSELNRELERRVEERTAELEAANREMEGFSYSVSHDLRAPLRAISATSSLLLEDLGPKLPPDSRELLERQKAAAIKLARLIDDLLAFARLGRQDVERQNTDLSEMAADVVEELQRAGRADDVQFEIQPFVTANVDRVMMRFVLMNLFDNACKFSPGGGKIQFGSKQGQRGKAYYVSDQGVGFDMIYADKLFVPFERLVREQEFPGTGIGLANVQRIIERHGGQVWAHAEPDKGATFYFTLG